MKYSPTRNVYAWINLETRSSNTVPRNQLESFKGDRPGDDFSRNNLCHISASQKQSLSQYKERRWGWWDGDSQSSIVLFVYLLLILPPCHGMAITPWYVGYTIQITFVRIYLHYAFLNRTLPPFIIQAHLSQINLLLKHVNRSWVQKPNGSPKGIIMECHGSGEETVEL